MVARMLGLFTVVLALFGVAGMAHAGVNIRVDLSSQRMQVTTPDGQSFNWAISSGREGYRTIRGNFRPTRLERNWYSRKYGGAMPNAIFFRGGFAIHGTSAVGALGRPASHGCVRLAPAHAARLFQLVRQHGVTTTRIAINGVAPDTGTRFAKAKPAQQKVALAKKKRQNADWQTARGRILDRGAPLDPGQAMGFRPVRGSPGDWWLRR